MRFRSIFRPMAVLLPFATFAWAAPPAVTFPGAAPGTALSAEKNGSFTLENQVLAGTWRSEGGTLRCVGVVNKVTGEHLDQSGTELFRLALNPPQPAPDATFVGIRLEPDKVVAVISKDGVAWTELSNYPRGDFPGEPKLVRLGKMNIKAEARDNRGDLGSEGEATISAVSPAIPAVPSDTLPLKAKAHQAVTVTNVFPKGTSFVSCRIDKGTDQGMTFGPALALIWEDGGPFLMIGLREKKPVFNLITAAGETIVARNPVLYPALDLRASAFHLTSPPKIMELATNPAGGRLADRITGAGIEAELVSDTGVHALWKVELRDGSNYIRQRLALSSPGKTIPLHGVEALDLKVPGCKTIGTAQGCPAASAGTFLGVEMPGAMNAINGPEVRIGFESELELSDRPYEFGSVFGVVPEGQLRRGFLYYLEREKARASKPFLHYNCWYDLGFSLSAETLLDVVRQFDKELVKKRGVPVLAYLADDGWDDPGTGLWAENPRKFPGGFKNLKQELDKLSAHLGVWISPLGGYGGAPERTKLAASMKLIPEGTQLDLAQPAYKKWFEDRCLQLMQEDGVNSFKWDRAGEGVSPHFMALLDVAHHLHAVNPEVFINVTVGTWPSPFWLNHVDSTWRMGPPDVGWAGKGDDREKWLTFRDGYCYQCFAAPSPLYPLNSAMHHGIVHGRCFQGERVAKSGNDLKNEARSYFANGALLQELYLTHSMMTDDAWDRVAEAAKWAHANADVLIDAHWTGGDPLKLEPYGYAA